MANPNPKPPSQGQFKPGHLSAGVQRRRISDKLLLELAQVDAKKLFEELKTIAYSTAEERKTLGIDFSDKTAAINKLLDKVVIVGKYSDFMDTQQAQNYISTDDLLSACAEEGVETKDAVKLLTIFKRVKDKKEEERFVLETSKTNE